MINGATQQLAASFAQDLWQLAGSTALCYGIHKAVNAGMGKTSRLNPLPWVAKGLSYVGIKSAERMIEPTNLIKPLTHAWDATCSLSKKFMDPILQAYSSAKIDQLKAKGYAINEIDTAREFINAQDNSLLNVLKGWVFGTETPIVHTQTIFVSSSKEKTAETLYAQAEQLAPKLGQFVVDGSKWVINGVETSVDFTTKAISLPGALAQTLSKTMNIPYEAALGIVICASGLSAYALYYGMSYGYQALQQKISQKTKVQVQNNNQQQVINNIHVPALIFAGPQPLAQPPIGRPALAQEATQPKKTSWCCWR